MLLAGMGNSNRIGVAVLGLLGVSIPGTCALAQDAPKPKSEDQTFTLSVPVNEVNLTFHVSDEKGAPLMHLRTKDFQLFDNGRRQSRIVAFHEYSDLPIRVGFLLDNSPSMDRQVERNQAIAMELVKEFFRPGVDSAFTMGFGVEAKLTQDWVDDGSVLSKGIASALEREGDEREGTAVFDALFRACRDKFAHREAAQSGNVILLFTDGIPEWKARASRGQQILEDLTSKTGGRVFYQSRQSNHDALASAVTDARYQYELVYTPAALKRDGSFHGIRLRCAERHAQIQVRSGYYAYVKP
jgi:hypothetical protein